MLARSIAAPQPDGRFAASVTPGSYRLHPQAPGIRQPVGRWFLASVSAAGTELLDAPIDLRTGISDVVVTFTDRPTEVSGRLVAANGDSDSDCYVVFFSTAREAWFPGSRRVAGVRAREDGTYSVRNLPPGTYWAVAVADMEEGEWTDPALLDRLTDGAVRVTLSVSERKLQDLGVR
jgi:hypothetical protein